MRHQNEISEQSQKQYNNQEGLEEIVNEKDGTIN